MKTKRESGIAQTQYSFVYTYLLGGLALLATVTMMVVL